jgi:hypothetical protein
MEEVLPGHPDVAECAVIGVADALKGQVPLGFVVLKSGVDRDPAEIEKELVALVRDEIGPVAAFKLAPRSSACPRRARARSCAARCEDRRRRGLDHAGHHRRPGDPRRGEHGHIVEAIAGRDPEMAELLMRRHVRVSRENVARQFAEHPDQSPSIRVAG